jgi:hypothetical protein
MTQLIGIPLEAFKFSMRNVRFGLPFQPVDATHALNRSAGVSKSNVFLGRSDRSKTGETRVRLRPQSDVARPRTPCPPSNEQPPRGDPRPCKGPR